MGYRRKDGENVALIVGNCRLWLVRFRRLIATVSNRFEGSRCRGEREEQHRIEDIAKVPLLSGVIELYRETVSLFLVQNDIRSSASEASECKAERHLICLLSRLHLS